MLLQKASALGQSRGREILSDYIFHIHLSVSILNYTQISSLGCIQILFSSHSSGFFCYLTNPYFSIFSKIDTSIFFKFYCSTVDFPGEGDGSTLQYSCLEGSMDRGAWRGTVHGMAKSRTQLSNYHSQLIYNVLSALAFISAV